MRRFVFRRYGGVGGLAPALFGILILCGVAAWALCGVREASRLSDAEEQRQAERALREAAVSCFVLEGAYPATYEQLKAYSGVAADEEKYVVFYEIFASNLMPEITVVERRGR